MTDFKALMVADDLRPFAPIEPPFSMNAANVAMYAPEVTGAYILHSVLSRLGWVSFADKSLLDFGCGVRLARTIHNLNMPFGLYVGVDVNAEAIGWLQTNLTDSRFRFEHLNTRNAMYNPSAPILDEGALEQLRLPACHIATMFSVVTHQSPDEAGLTFKQLRRIVDGALYFTAFLDEGVTDYSEGAPGEPGLKSTYHPAYLVELVESSGWRVRSIHPQRNTMQQPVFICDSA